AARKEGRAMTLFVPTPIPAPPPPPRPGGPLERLVLYARALAPPGWDPVAGPTTRAPILSASLAGVAHRRGELRMWRHAARLQRAVERGLGVGPGTETTGEAIRRILADGQPHAFTPDRRTTRILLDLALAGECIVVGPIGGTVQAA